VPQLPPQANQLLPALLRDAIADWALIPLKQSKATQLQQVTIRSPLWAFIIFASPALYDLPGFGQGREPVGIQAFGPEGPVE